MNAMVPTVFLIAAAAAAAVGTRVLIPWLERSSVLDHPNQRSSHLAPTPRGAGLAVVVVAVVLWLAAAVMGGPGTIDEPLVWVAGGAAVLCVLSWIDDLSGLPPWVRFTVHAVVVATLLWRLPPDVVHFQGVLPLWADRLAAALAWLWFINLFNFMDGIDGISGVETIAIGIGVVLIGLLGGNAMGLASAGAVLAGAGAGFLVWNWHPAKVFLGDAGSVPLGLMLGWLLLELAAVGLWAAALILPFYYLADATVTILRRAARGERVWQAHREHFYQQAVARGLGHDRVALLIAAADVGLIALAVLSLVSTWPALTGAAVLTAALLVIFRGRAIQPNVHP